MNIQKLKKIALDVKGWSNCNESWIDSIEENPTVLVGHIDEDGSKYPVASVDCDQYYAAEDSIKLARFYAAANPETVLKLIGLIEDLEAKTLNT